jgi:hypothetical protein
MSMPNLATSYRARFYGLGALLVAGIVTFLAMRPPAAPEKPQMRSRCSGRAHVDANHSAR